MQNTKQKLKKAENLRNKAISTEKESSKAVNVWVKTTLGTADYEKARKASNRAEEKADKAYDAYYNYVHANFEKEKIDQSFHKVCQDKKNKRKFLSKAFLDGLKK